MSFGMERPDHPDLERLIEVVQRMEAPMDAATTDDEKTRIWNEEVAKFIDVESLTYFALQRAFRALGIETGAEFVARRDEVIPQVQMYVDGFLMASNYAAYTELDRKIPDTQRRTDALRNAEEN